MPHIATNSPRNFNFFWNIPTLFIPAQEIKNSLFDRYCATLCAASAFDNISHEHLTVGHTHEDVGDFAAFRLFVPTMSVIELNFRWNLWFGKLHDSAETLYLD